MLAVVLPGRDSEHWAARCAHDLNGHAAQDQTGDGGFGTAGQHDQAARGSSRGLLVCAGAVVARGSLTGRAGGRWCGRQRRPSTGRHFRGAAAHGVNCAIWVDQKHGCFASAPSSAAAQMARRTGSAAIPE